MGYFAVIDTETNRAQVMSIGTVIADADTFQSVAAKYHILSIACEMGSIYYNTPNVCFDRNHLPKLRDFDWHDIVRIAASRRHNSKIPACADCRSTGRLKRGYSVEPVLRLLSGNCTYRETHNALFDALDEPEIVRLLGLGIHEYILL